MINSITTTKLGCNSVKEFGDKKSLSYLEANILACSVDGVTLQELHNRLNECYPVEVDYKLLVNKLVALEKRQLIYILREIEDSMMVTVEYHFMKFRCRFGDLKVFNSALSFKEIEKELAYKQTALILDSKGYIAKIKLERFNS